VSVLNKFESEIFIEKDGYRINAKSIIGVLTLAAVKGTVLLVIAEGKDAEEALDAAEELFDDGFGEEDLVKK
jgi:phosphocarrier protein